jgi:steroid 5-alpha reductase family enzyme
VASELALNLGVALIPMIALWLLSIPLRNVSIVDAYWGPGFVLVSAWAAWRGEALGPREWMLMACVGLWGGRLGLYLLWRNAGHGEDRRYLDMRRRYGPSFWLSSLLIVFLLQGSLQWLVSLPVQLAMQRGSQDITPVHVVGAVVWLCGWIFETIGDWQLARFKADPTSAGKVMDRGLWRYTRHPNYFGDFLVWWGLFAMAWSQPADAWSVIGPLTMSLFLLRVSGVSLLEQDIAERRPGYTEYVRRTSAFVPWWPRS